jgi:hypothetical protein
MAKDIGNTGSYTNGAYQIPEDDDSGSIVFSLLEDFMERIAEHNHTGGDSKSITSNFTKVNTILTPSWSGHTFTSGLASGSSTGSYKCTINISTTQEQEAGKLDIGAALDRDSDDINDVSKHTQILKFFYKDQDPATDDDPDVITDKFFWQPFDPDYTYTGDSTIELYSNVQFSRIRVVQY